MIASFPGPAQLWVACWISRGPGIFSHVSDVRIERLVYRKACLHTGPTEQQKEPRYQLTYHMYLGNCCTHQALCVVGWKYTRKKPVSSPNFQLSHAHVRKIPGSPTFPHYKWQKAGQSLETRLNEWHWMKLLLAVNTQIIVYWLLLHLQYNGDHDNIDLSHPPHCCVALLWLSLASWWNWMRSLNQTQQLYHPHVDPRGEGDRGRGQRTEEGGGEVDRSSTVLTTFSQTKVAHWTNNTHKNIGVIFYSNHYYFLHEVK